VIDINEEVLKSVNSSFIIPPQPEVLAELQSLAKQESPELSQVAETVSKDVGVSSTVLKVINSPAYGLSRTVTDIKQAVMFLGLDSIFTLVRGLKLKEAFNQEKSCINLGRFWDSATEIANVAMYLGNRIKSKVPIENLYTLGLFHDAGIPAMAVNYKDYVRVLAYVNKNYDVHIIDIEEAKYKTNHAVIGYYLATNWHLPKELCQLILCHHELDYLNNIDGSISQLSFAVLKMAENIVHSERRFIAAPDWVHVKEQVLNALGMTEDDYRDVKEDIATDLWS
jgi:HD-like signal output (HDOD) protein